jgi:Flp pilus assembly protein TadD
MISWSAFGLATAARGRAGWLLPAVATAALAALGAVSYRQTDYWRDSVALARRALAATTGNWLAHAMLGNAFFERGNLAGAEREFVETLKIMPIMPEIRNNLGNVYLLQGRVDEAIREYTAAVAQNPADTMAKENLRRALATRGTSTGAGEHFRKGNLLYRQGRMDEAVREYRAALSLDPSSADAHSNLGSALNGLGRPAEAIVEFRQAVSLAPDVADYHYNLGVALDRAGEGGEAAAQFRQALRLEPGLTEARRALERIGRDREP